MALKDLIDGASIKDLEKALKYYEELEDYEACAGILKAIEEIEYSTIKSIKNKLNEIRDDKNLSRGSD
jgi:hypothetical protein